LAARPFGYEGKSALHTDQKDPTGTNNDHPYMAYRPIQISLVEVKPKGEPLGDALSA